MPPKKRSRKAKSNTRGSAASETILAFVVARSNPLRFMKEPPELEDLMNTIRGKVGRFNVDKIRQEDIVASGGGAADEE